MPLSTAQLATLKTAINADATAAAFSLTSDGDFNLAAYLNAVPPAPISVWRNDIQPGEVSRVVQMSAFVALTAIKQNGLILLTQGTIDASAIEVRSGFTAIFGAGSTLTALTALAQRPATRFEAIFSTAAAPANTSVMFGKQASPDDIHQARVS